LNKNFIPTPQDESLRMEAVITKTADFVGTTFDNGVGFTPGGIGMPVAAVVNVSACVRNDSDETYSFKLQESSDDSTWTDCGPSVTIDVSAATSTLGGYSVPGFLSKRYSRLNLDVAGTTPSITYEAWQNPNIR